MKPRPIYNPFSFPAAANTPPLRSSSSPGRFGLWLTNHRVKTGDAQVPSGVVSAPKGLTLCGAKQRNAPENVEPPFPRGPARHNRVMEAAG